jgi:transposase-like protein
VYFGSNNQSEKIFQLRKKVKRKQYDIVGLGKEKSMGSNFLGIKAGRQQGNLLPTPKPAEKPSECVRYFIDTAKYATERIVEPITEPEVYKAPEGSWLSPNDMPTENPEVIKMRRDDFMKKRLDMPTKEELMADMKKVSNGEIAKKHGVSHSTAMNWIRHYGIQRKKGSTITEGDIESDTTQEVIVSPSQEQIEQFYNDVPQEPQPSEGLTPEEKEKLVELGYTEFAPKREFDEIWSDVKDDLVVLRAMYIKKAEREFDARLSELIKALGGDEAC